jgi:hypothetical protein
MAFGDPPPNVARWPQPSARSNQTALPSASESDQDPEEQWLFQYHEHLLLTVQAIHRLHQAISERMLGPVK